MSEKTPLEKPIGGENQAAGETRGATSAGNGPGSGKRGGVEEIAAYAAEKNLIVGKEALGLLGNAADYRRIIDGLASDGCVLLDAKNVRNKIVQAETKLKPVKTVEIRKGGFRALAKDVGPNCRVLGDYDVTGQSSAKGRVDDFLGHFRDRFNALNSILATRGNFRPNPISRAMKLPDSSEVEFSGMVNKKWESKNGNDIILVEDLEDTCICVVPQTEKRLVLEAKHVLLDDVIGIRGKKIRGGMVIVSDILWPELPNKPMRAPERDLSVAVISDMHIGSKLFLEKEFDRFLAWISGKSGSGKELERLGRVKYLAVCGDNVDGVGVYPNQYDELAVKDIYEQYNLFCTRIAAVPEYIEVFICPGQHDAVRRADPQPAIPKEFVSEIAGLGNVHLVGSPSWFEIEGLKCLIYHGASLHDLYHAVDFLSSERPQEAMAEMLKHRNLMPGYGIRQPYVPEPVDFTVLRAEPDFYFGGDMHHIGYAMYKNCLVCCASTWQKQTAYQVEQGHVPTPGIVPDIRLKDRHIMENRFYEGR